MRKILFVTYKVVSLNCRKLYWLDEDRLFQSAANGAKLTELKLKPADVNATQNAHSLVVNGDGEDYVRLIWTQPHLNVTRLLNLQTMTVHTMKLKNNSNSSASLIAVDSYSGEFFFYEQRSGNISARLTDEYNGVQLINSTRLLRTNTLGLISMKLVEKDVFSQYGIKSNLFMRFLKY